MPPCIALTGGIGSGKSAALVAFARCGAATLSSDEVVHRLYRDPQVVAAVAERFGRDVVGTDGTVDRAALGPRAFADEGGMAFLQGLLYPRIEDERRRWIAEQEGRLPAPPLLVCEVPLLYEAGLADRFDAVLVVTASEDVRRSRVERRGQRFDQRSALQMAEEEKVARADSTMVNEGTLESLESWVRDEFRRRAGVPCASGEG